MRHKVHLVFLALLLGCFTGCGQANGDSPDQVRYPFILTTEEIGQARDLAEKDMPLATLSTGPGIVFIKVDLLPDSQAETTQRLVMVHHYRYANDETIFTMIDLRSHEIKKREFMAHYPTALAPAEVHHALQLARDDNRLRHFFEIVPTEFDVRPLQYASSQDPFFGHRVVHVLMRQDGNYLVNPRVLVDLTTATVHVETNQAPHRSANGG